MVKKYYLYVELANYYLGRFEKKENFVYHLKNFINEDVGEFNTTPKNIDAICYYGWKVYNSLNIEEKKNFIYALICMSHKVIESFRNLKLVEVKNILTSVRVNEEIFKNNYFIFDEDTFRFLMYDRDDKQIGDISNYGEVVELCKYFRIPIGGINHEMENSNVRSIIINIDNIK
jgi:hypothetical protein